MASHPYRRIWLVGLLLLIAIILAARLGYESGMIDSGSQFLTQYLKPERLPDHLIVANGRLEATQIDVATKLAGRLTAVSAREGDTVKAGSVVARLDTISLEAQLRQAKAELRRAEKDREYALAIVAQRESERGLAGRELKRLLELEQQSYAAVEQVDQARTAAHCRSGTARQPGQGGRNGGGH